MSTGKAPLHHGLHVWLTEEMGFVYRPPTDDYQHPTRDICVSGEALRLATLDMADPDQMRMLIAQLFFEGFDV